MAADSSREPVHMTEIILPSHTNALGTAFGGVIMSWIDIGCAIAARRYCRNPAVTVSIDYLHFKNPIKLGHAVLITARVTWAGRTSMEVEAIVLSEDSVTGEVKPATHAYLTFVSVDKDGKPVPVPKFQPRNKEEEKSFKEAELRREQRLKFRDLL